MGLELGRWGWCESDPAYRAGSESAGTPYAREATIVSRPRTCALAKGGVVVVVVVE